MRRWRIWRVLNFKMSANNPLILYIFNVYFIETWSVVLWIHGIILLLTNVFFCIFASSRPARWTLETYNNKVAPSEPEQIVIKTSAIENALTNPQFH